MAYPPKEYPIRPTRRDSQSQWRLQPRAKFLLHIVRRPLTFWEAALSISGEFSTLVHPTDFEPDSGLAFVHAVRLALRAKQTLTLFNIAVEGEAPHGAPIKRVVDLLMRWNELPAHSTVEALEHDLGFRVVSARVPASNPRAGIVDYIENHPCELAVIATRDHRGLSRWLERSVAERVLRLATTMVLILRQRSRAFVKPKTGRARAETRARANRRRLRSDAGARTPGSLARQATGGSRDSSLPRRLGAAGGSNQLPSGRAYETTLREGPTAPTILDYRGELVGRSHSRADSASQRRYRGAARFGLSQILDDARWPVLSLPAH